MGKSKWYLVAPRYTKPKWYEYRLKRWLKYCDNVGIPYELIDNNGKTIKAATKDYRRINRL